MIKVAHTATVYNSTVTILYSKLQALNQYEDLDVSVISSSNNSGEVRKPPVRHIVVEMARTIKLLSDLKSIWWFYKILKRENFDIVHSHTAKAGFITAIAAKLAKVPLVFHTYHGLPFFDGQDKKLYFMYRFLEKIACKFRDHIFTQNKQDLLECIKLVGAEEKVSFEGNGVDVEFVNQSAKDQLNDAAKDYPCRGLRVIQLSRLEPVKRVSDFLEVVSKLIGSGVEVSCVVAGGGPLKQKLKSQLVEMGLSQCVNMVGRSVKPQGLIKASDIVVLCSEKEGIPRSLMEAMALQKPVVATDVLGTQELVLDGQTGFLVPLGDIDSMVGKIKLLSGNAALRTKLGSAGQERVRQYFNDVNVADFLHGFYLRAVSKNTS